MKFETSRFGQVDVREDGIIHIKDGILGFPEDRRFCLLELDTVGPFKWLQSLDNSNLAFVIIDPRLFIKEYAVALEPEEAEAISVEDPGECMVYCIVTIGSDPSNVTANLAGPIVINARTRQAKQVVLVDSGYSVRHRILD